MSDLDTLEYRGPKEVNRGYYSGLPEERQEALTKIQLEKGHLLGNNHDITRWQFMRLYRMNGGNPYQHESVNKSIKRHNAEKNGRRRTGHALELSGPAPIGRTKAFKAIEENELNDSVVFKEDEKLREKKKKTKGYVEHPHTDFVRWEREALAVGSGSKRKQDKKGVNKSIERHYAKSHSIPRVGTKAKINGISSILGGTEITDSDRLTMILDVKNSNMAKIDPKDWKITSRASIDSNGNIIKEPAANVENKSQIATTDHSTAKVIEDAVVEDAPESLSQKVNKDDIEDAVILDSPKTNNRSEAVKEKVRQVREESAARREAKQTVQNAEKVSNEAQAAKSAAKNVDKGIMSEAWNFIKGHKRILGIGGGLAVAGAVAYGIAYNRGKGSTY